MFAYDLPTVDIFRKRAFLLTLKEGRHARIPGTPLVERDHSNMTRPGAFNFHPAGVKSPMSMLHALCSAIAVPDCKDCWAFLCFDFWPEPVSAPIEWPETSSEKGVVTPNCF